MVIGTTSVETLTRVRVTVDTKDWWAVAIVPAARQSAPPLPALIALLAFSFLDTGIATPARVVTDLIIGAAPFCTTSQTEAVRTTDLSRNAVVIPGTKIETEARVLISPTATAALGTVAGFIAMQNTTALRSISWHAVALIGTQLPPWTRSSARLKKADLIAPEQTTSIAQPGRTVLATLAVLTARSTQRPCSLAEAFETVSLACEATGGLVAGVAMIILLAVHGRSTEAVLAANLLARALIVVIATGSRRRRCGDPTVLASRCATTAGTAATGLRASRESPYKEEDTVTSHGNSVLPLCREGLWFKEKAVPVNGAKTEKPWD